MLPARRLYHCSRCLRIESKDGLRLPRPSVPEPLGYPSSPTTQPETANPDQSIPLHEPLGRVSLSYEATRKVPPRNWQKPLFKSTARPLTPVRNPLVEDDLQRQLNQVRREFSKDMEAEVFAEQSGTRSDRRPLPPVPAPHAVHCTIEPIPMSWMASDVIRLVTSNPEKNLDHRLPEATRIYEDNLIPTTRYRLRFHHPSHLQTFLTNNLQQCLVDGHPIRARIFHDDADLSKLRLGSLHYKGLNANNILRCRDVYFRDFTGKSVVVLVEGIPNFAGLPTITYLLQILYKDEGFEWAFDWTNAPGKGDKFEPNAVLVKIGGGIGKMSNYGRWVFMLKDRENAWRFARKMNMQYFREDRYGTDYITKAFVLD